MLISSCRTLNTKYQRASMHPCVQTLPTLLAASHAGRVDMLLLVLIPLSPGWILEISTPSTFTKALASTRIRERPIQISSPSAPSPSSLLMLSTVRSASRLAALLRVSRIGDARDKNYAACDGSGSSAFSSLRAVHLVQRGALGACNTQPLQHHYARDVSKTPSASTPFKWINRSSSPMATKIGPRLSMRCVWTKDCARPYRRYPANTCGA